MTKGSKNGWMSRRAVFLGSVGVFLLVVLWLGFSSDGDRGDAAEPERQVRAVTVVEIVAARHRAEIAGLAEVTPRWVSEVRAQVGGVLVMVSEDLQPGTRVAEGQLLASLDRTPWLANLAEAENRLALAELELLRQEQEAAEARDSWGESGLGGDPESELVLRGPQIAAAVVQMEAARTARDWAARQLGYTEIRAPFAGIVAARHVSHGESVLEGEAVAQIFATDVFEAALQVSGDQWSHLATPVIGAEAELVDPEGRGRWRARIIREAGALDPATRMRTLFLAVSDPLDGEAPLLPGSFVEARLAGAVVEKVLELPEGALTRGGHIWYVDGKDTLRRFEAEPLFTRPGLIYVAEPSPAPGWRIIRYPLDSFMVGQAVSLRSEHDPVPRES